MELEVGMYVRTKIGIIGKIISIDKNSHNNNVITIFNGKFHIIHNETRTEFDITKASHNIIDLIEVGDYVNEMQVRQISSYEDNEKYLEFVEDFYLELLNREIKSIVTKEQFESMAYKIGD